LISLIFPFLWCCNALCQRRKKGAILLPLQELPYQTFETAFIDHVVKIQLIGNQKRGLKTSLCHQLPSLLLSNFPPPDSVTDRVHEPLEFLTRFAGPVSCEILDIVHSGIGYPETRPRTEAISSGPKGRGFAFREPDGRLRSIIRGQSDSWMA